MKITNNTKKDLILVFGLRKEKEPTGSLNLKKQDSIKLNLEPFDILQIEEK